MQSNDAVAQLHAVLADLRGPARIGPLTQLGQALMERYWRAGPGSPVGLPDLDAAIAAFAEAYGLIDGTDPLRGHVAALFGWTLTARCGAHPGATDENRKTGIQVLEVACASPALPPQLVAMSRMNLGQLHLIRAMGSLQTTELTMAAINAGADPGTLRGLNRAVDCFRSVVNGPRISEQLIDGASTMLALAEALQVAFGGLGGGVAGLDIGRMMQAMAMLQKIQEEGRRRGNPALGLPGPPGLMPYVGADELVRLGPMHYPVPVLLDQESPASPAASPAHRPAASPVNLTEQRQRLHAQVADSGQAVGAPVWSAAAQLLSPATPDPTSETVDRLVALASLVADQSAPDATTTGIDQYVLATTLRLRGRRDPAHAKADLQAGAQALLRAANLIAPSHPAAVTVLGSLGAFLDGWQPGDDTLEPLASAFADRIDVVLATATVGGAEIATLHALRCLCRAMTSREHEADLRRSVGAAPLDYPWLDPLTEAAALTATISPPSHAG
jgi:hypothetical protein